MGSLWPLRQCAAVISRSPPGLWTTLAVQKCQASLPRRVVNSAPTAALPGNNLPLRDRSRLPLAASLDAATTMLAVTARTEASTAVPAARGSGRASQDAFTRLAARGGFLVEALDVAAEDDGVGDGGGVAALLVPADDAN